jgi:hypothetical protein
MNELLRDAAALLGAEIKHQVKSNWTSTPSRSCSAAPLNSAPSSTAC